MATAERRFSREVTQGRREEKVQRTYAKLGKVGAVKGDEYEGGGV
jgi:hypothetical protein